MGSNEDMQMLLMLRDKKTRDDGFRLLMNRYKEMAEILNSSENALKTNYHYATEKIKAYLKETE